MENNDGAAPAAADVTASAGTGNEPLLTPETGAAGQVPAGTPPAEGKPASGDEPLLNPEAGKGEEKQGAPESYQDFTVPEGFTLEGETLTEATGMFKELNLSQSQAQKLVDYYTRQQLAQQEKVLSDLQSKRKAWREEIRSQPDFAERKADAQRGMRALCDDPMLKELFTNSWMSDHPALFGMFAKVGKLLGEDHPLPRGGEPPKSLSDTERYPVKL